ncbi:FAD-dependent monooxygenase [Aurantimonas sp. 22II-16-19i]|uniref:FAD-dependent monooxygenase n=1 Tax=Aurantimonas sp. 22II-16-19i TaxID=1317114 RepID=UPI0009F7A2E2|nr:FAD-dependent monooxygenase [Aurantimonas sp. 22II-16-19i]ORE98055.1 salicylate hydroxylase [Aurantimonas sp. 22II-16-19i]
MIARQSPSIAIVGAGIGGLAAGLCLARVGLASTIFERAETLEEVGAGLQLSPNALSVMDRLGLLPALRKVGVAADRVELLGHRSGRRIAEVPVHSADGTPYLSIHRAELQAVLVAAVRAEPAITLTLGAELRQVASDDAKVEISSGDGGPERFDLLVGADGVRSTVARLSGLAPAAPTGATAWRMTIAGDAASAFAGPGGSRTAPAGIRAWLGPARHAVVYPVRAGRAVNLVLIAPSRAPGSGEQDDTQDLISGFSRWDPRLASLIDTAPTPTPWPLFGAPTERPYVLGHDRVVLLGDAAHAMAPYAAQGAAMAIEDAAVLAAALAETDDPRRAARRYEAERRLRIDKVRGRVGFHRLVYHLPAPFSLARNAVLALRPPAALRADLSWLYDWRAPALDPRRPG